MDGDDKDIVSGLRRKALPVKRSGVEEREKPPWRNDETVISWIAKRCALHAYQRDTTNNRLKEDERNASLAFKRAAQEAKDEDYEDFCANVNEDRALFLFWKLYWDMQSKQRVQALPD